MSSMSERIRRLMAVQNDGGSQGTARRPTVSQEAIASAGIAPRSTTTTNNNSSSGLNLSNSLLNSSFRSGNSNSNPGVRNGVGGGGKRKRNDDYSDDGSNPDLLTPPCSPIRISGGASKKRKPSDVPFNAQAISAQDILHIPEVEYYSSCEEDGDEPSDSSDDDDAEGGGNPPVGPSTYRSKNKHPADRCFLCNQGPAANSFSMDGKALNACFDTLQKLYGTVDNGSVARQVHKQYMTTVYYPLKAMGFRIPKCTSRNIKEHIEGHVQEPVIFIHESIRDLKMRYLAFNEMIFYRDPDTGRNHFDDKANKASLEVLKHISILYKTPINDLNFRNPQWQMKDANIGCIAHIQQAFVKS